MKRQITVIVLILIILISIQMIIQENRLSINQDNNHLKMRSNSIIKVSERYLNSSEMRESLDEITIDSFELIEEIGYKTGRALEAEDIQEFNKLHTFGQVLITKHYAASQNQLIQKSFKKKIINIWEEVSDGIEYDEVVFNLPEERILLYLYYGYLPQCYFWYNIYKNNIFPIDPNYIDSGTFSYKYFENILPYFIWIIITLIFSDTINKDIREGSIKLSLNHMFSRKKYLYLKTISNCISSIIILISPLALINLFLLFKNGLINYKYPVLFLKGGLNSFKVIPNFIEFDKSALGRNEMIGLSKYSLIPKGEIGISNRLGFIPIYKMILLSIIILVFIIMFYNVLNILISILVKNQITSLIVASTIIIVSKFLTKEFIYNENLNLVPFNMDNPIRILAGTYNSNFLIAILSLFLTSLLIYVGSIYVFNKKDL